MTSEISLNAGTLAAQQQTTAQQSNQLSQDFDDFLNLLTTQLQNQDPLSPMDSTEFTNQLVQFSQVEQQIAQNEKLDQMLSLQLAGTSNVALGYVGLDIGYIGDLFYSNGSDPREINYALQGDAVSSKIFIRDVETGEVVRSLDAATAAGNHSITWDGLDDNGDPVAPGNYRLSVDALDNNDNAIPASTAVSGRVVGIESVNGVIQLLLEGDAIVPVSSVINAKTPVESVDGTNDQNQGGSNDNTSSS
jgi:flagellar basal-body rod modification protein FlgD